MTQQQNEHGLGADFFLAIGAQVGEMYDKMLGGPDHDSCTYQNPVVVNVGTVTLDDEGQLGPVRGQCWSVRRISAWGFSAGSVQIQLNALEPAASFAAAGTQYYGRGELLLQPGDRLVIVPTGITGNVYVAIAPDAFPYWHLGKYLR